MDNPSLEPVKTAEPARYRFNQRSPLLFTTSKWNALSHISGPHTAVESAELVRPEEVFPFRVLRAVDYGVNNAGLVADVVAYRSADGAKLGVILFVLSGPRDNQILGCYAMRQSTEA